MSRSNFYSDVRDKFTDLVNIRYLRRTLAKQGITMLDEEVYAFSNNMLDGIMRDNRTMRDDPWDAVRRANTKFVKMKNDEYMTPGPVDVFGNGAEEVHEPYHIKMLMRDSLRPPNLEYINTPGYSMITYSQRAYEQEKQTGRAMRYPEIPFWQQLNGIHRSAVYSSNDGYAGYQNSELEQPTRGWDIEKLLRG